MYIYHEKICISSPSLNITDFCPSDRCFELPSRLRTPTGTMTVGG